MEIPPSGAGGAGGHWRDLVWPRCGVCIDWAPRSDLPLELSVTVPDEPLTEADALGLAGLEVRVTNVSGSALRVMTGRGAHLTLVRDGLVVATAPGQRGSAHTYELEPGAGPAYLSGVSLRRCTDGPPSRESAPLPPGIYQLYAAQMFTLGSDWDTRFAVQAGPWDLAVGRTIRG
jgi:hypothetical protein